MVISAAQLAAQSNSRSPAGTAEERVVRELLASNDPAAKAWGAELAARYQFQDVCPELLNLLDWTDSRVQEQAIDSLIRLRATVPTENLRRLLAQQHAAPIILASLHRNPEILKEALSQSLTDAQWVAANQGVLTIDGPRDYVLDLLKSWTIHVTLRVVDAGADHSPEPGQRGGVCGDSFTRQVDAGFPPRAVYRIQLSAEPGDRVLNARPHPVYYRRSLTASGCDIIIDRDEYRSDFLALILNTPPVKPRLRSRQQRDIVWNGPGDYRTQIEQLCREIDAGFHQIVADLTRRTALQRSRCGWPEGECRTACHRPPRESPNATPLTRISHK